MLLEKLFVTVVLIPEFEIFVRVAPGFEAWVPGFQIFVHVAAGFEVLVPSHRNLGAHATAQASGCGVSDLVPKPRSRDPEGEHVGLGLTILCRNLEAQPPGGASGSGVRDLAPKPRSLHPPGKHVGLGFVILQHKLEDQTHKVRIRVWGWRFCTDISKPRPTGWVCGSGVRDFAAKPRSPEPPW